MNANLNTGMNEIRALSAVELDAVSGGAVIKLYDLRVAGMQIVGVANTDNGCNTTWVGGSSVGPIIRTGKQQ